MDPNDETVPLSDLLFCRTESEIVGKETGHYKGPEPVAGGLCSRAFQPKF